MMLYAHSTAVKKLCDWSRSHRCVAFPSRLGQRRRLPERSPVGNYRIHRLSGLLSLALPTGRAKHVQSSAHPRDDAQLADSRLRSSVWYDILVRSRLDDYLDLPTDHEKSKAGMRHLWPNDGAPAPGFGRASRIFVHRF